MSEKEDSGIVGAIQSLVQRGVEQEAGFQLTAANKRIAELEEKIKEQAEALLKPSDEGQKLIDQAMAAVKVHSVRARTSIAECEEFRRQTILLKRELAAVKQELEDLKTAKAKEAAEVLAALPPVEVQPALKVRRSLRRLSPRPKVE